MYSPRIKEDLVPKLYRIAKEEGLAMTKLVDQILRDGLSRRKNKKGRENEVKMGQF